MLSNRHTLYATGYSASRRTHVQIRPGVFQTQYVSGLWRLVRTWSPNSDKSDVALIHDADSLTIAEFIGVTPGQFKRIHDTVSDWGSVFNWESVFPIFPFC